MATAQTVAIEIRSNCTKAKNENVVHKRSATLNAGLFLSEHIEYMEEIALRCIFISNFLSLFLSPHPPFFSIINSTHAAHFLCEIQFRTLFFFYQAKISRCEQSPIFLVGCSFSAIFHRDSKCIILAMSALSMWRFLKPQAYFSEKRLNELLNKFELYIDKNVNSRWKKTRLIYMRTKNSVSKNEMAKLSESHVVARGRQRGWHFQ